jgi:hypothetical protein
MAFKTSSGSLAALLVALACTLGLVALTLVPAQDAMASCSGITQCIPGDYGIQNTQYCCCSGKKLRQRRDCTSNCTWGNWYDYDCGGPGCSPHGFCA